MITVQEIRKKYPQYSDLNDQELADSLYNKYYSDLPKEEFYSKIGIDTHVPRITKNSSDIRELWQAIKDIPSTATEFAKGADESFLNFPAQIANLILPKNMQLKMIGDNDPGTPYKAGEIAGNIGTFMAGGGLLNSARSAAEALPALGRVAKWFGKEGTPEALGRALGASSYGAIESPEDRGFGAALGAAGSAAAELLPYGLKGIAGASEYVNPLKYTNKLVSNIKDSYKAAKEEASSYFNPVMNKYGNTFITSPGIVSSYKSLNKDLIKDSYDYDLKKMHQAFMDNPTFKNAHDLQSQLGTEVRSLNSATPDAATRKTITGLNQARNALKADMIGYLDNQDKSMSDLYKKGSEIFASKVSPFRENKTISQLATGTQKTITPTKFINELTKVTEKGNVPENHFLYEVLGDISSKVNKGKAAYQVVPLLVGGITGAGISPGAGGATLGAVAGKLASPILKVPQNPAVEKIVHMSEPYYRNLVKSLLATVLGNR